MKVVIWRKSKLGKPYLTIKKRDTEIEQRRLSPTTGQRLQADAQQPIQKKGENIQILKES